jgi:hypothetical protein
LTRSIGDCRGWTWMTELIKQLTEREGISEHVS